MWDRTNRGDSTFIRSNRSMQLYWNWLPNVRTALLRIRCRSQCATECSVHCPTSVQEFPTVIAGDGQSVRREYLLRL